MSSNHTATLQGANTYDDCLIAACLKKLFLPSTRGKAEPGYTITDRISTLKGDLEFIRKESPAELSYAYLYAMESTLPAVGFRYMMVRRNNMPVLFAYFQLYTLTSHNFNLNKDKTFVKGILKFFLDLKKARVVLSGNALRSETPCCWYDADVLTSEVAAECIVSAAEKIAADEHASGLVLKDIPLSAHTQKWLKGMGYEAPFEDRVMTLDINADWQNLEGYTAALSRKYKTRANKILAARDHLETRVLSEQEIRHYQPRIHKLFNNVATNQSFALTAPADDHFTRLKLVYQQNFEVTGIFVEGELAAFFSAVISPAAYELYYVGLDYELNTQYQLYFNILFAGLERAMQLNKQQLKLGRTSFDAKASIGAKPVTLPYLAKTGNIPGVVSKWFVNYFSSMEDGKWKLRNPMKDQAVGSAQEN